MTQLNEKEMQLATLLSEECATPAELTAKLKNLFAGALEKMLEAEMEEHLGYEKNSVLGNNSGNSRNGYGKKTVKSEWGESEINVPRDRTGTFEPQVIEKRQTRTDDIEARILAMYAKGMSNRDIEDHLRDIYGVEASPSLISRITDKIMPAVAEWQSRPLDPIYPIVFLDGIVFKGKRITRKWLDKKIDRLLICRFCSKSTSSECLDSTEDSHLNYQGTAEMARQVNLPKYTLNNGVGLIRWL